MTRKLSEETKEKNRQRLKAWREGNREHYNATTRAANQRRQTEIKGFKDQIQDLKQQIKELEK